MNQSLRPDMGDIVFAPRKKESAVHEVINSIKSLLLTGKLQPGDKLPPENELSQALSISRGSIREAMKILSAYGIVEIKQGDGTYISNSEHNVVFEPLLFRLILTKPDKKALSELRELMEFAIVKLIIENAGDEDIARIKREYEKMAVLSESPENNIADLMRYELDFHMALGMATKNILVEKIYAFVMEFFMPSVIKTYEYEKDAINTLSLHKNILDALLERDLAKALIAVKDSINVWSEKIKKS